MFNTHESEVRQCAAPDTKANANLRRAVVAREQTSSSAGISHAAHAWSNGAKANVQMRPTAAAAAQGLAV